VEQQKITELRLCKAFGGGEGGAAVEHLVDRRAGRLLAQLAPRAGRRLAPLMTVSPGLAGPSFVHFMLLMPA
jgi:hypothetical protein